MALKVRDFASSNGHVDNVSGRVKEERRREEEEDDLICYDPPGGSGSYRRSRDRRSRSRSRRRSRSRSRRSESRRHSATYSPPQYERVPRNLKDEKPYFGPRDDDGNIQVTNMQILFDK